MEQLFRNREYPFHFLTQTEVEAEVEAAPLSYTNSAVARADPANKMGNVSTRRGRVRAANQALASAQTSGITSVNPKCRAANSYFS